jgi:hypothetical protein
VGGVNLKAVARSAAGDARALERPYEIWRAPAVLGRLLVEMGAELGEAPLHAVTMTAELSDCFDTKREGVAAVVGAVVRAFPESRVRVFGVKGFVPPERAKLKPLDVAGANWHASATWLARELPAGGILLDVGSTTADVIPFGAGFVLARGATDTARLLEGELVYTGALRTPLGALLESAPLGGRECPVAAEHFAIVADAHLWLGAIEPAAYTCPTPDGRARTREAAAARIARMVCADRETLTDDDVTAIASRAAEIQILRIARALARVAARLAPEAETGVPALATPRVFTAGSGDWLAEAAARRAGLPFEALADRLGPVARLLPAWAVAQLAGAETGGRSPSEPMGLLGERGRRPPVSGASGASRSTGRGRRPAHR